MVKDSFGLELIAVAVIVNVDLRTRRAKVRATCRVRSARLREYNEAAEWDDYDLFLGDSDRRSNLAASLRHCSKTQKIPLRRYNEILSNTARTVRIHLVQAHHPTVHPTLQFARRHNSERFHARCKIVISTILATQSPNFSAPLFSSVLPKETNEQTNKRTNTPLNTQGVFMCSASLCVARNILSIFDLRTNLEAVERELSLEKLRLWFSLLAVTVDLLVPLRVVVVS